MRAKQFVRSLLIDLKEDTLALRTAIDFGYKKMESVVTQSTQQRTVVEYETMLAKAREILIAIGKDYHLE